MNAATAHRGPDGTAVAVFKGATFGHNRLAIIDPEPRSNQPMMSVDGQFALILNGEIYNFKELKKELSDYPFRTESDTEVVLAGYQKWGGAVFERLNGMYAVAIYENKTNTVILARDPVGIKPLYISKTQQGYAFSSEIKALLTLGIPRTLNRNAFDVYMRTLYVPAPATMFAGVEHVMPGTVVRITGRELDMKKFSYRAQAASLDWCDTKGLKQAVIGSVSRQLLSDRPLGIYLSGGIDSSAILASAAQIRGSMDTFSVSFALSEEEEAGKFNADADLARRSARHYGATHHDFVVLPEEVFPLFEKAVYHLDQPIGNATVAAQAALSAFTRDKAVVVLTGDGGDEVFGGYERYRLSQLMDAAQRSITPGLMRAFPHPTVQKLGIESLTDRFALFHFQKDHELSDVLTQLPTKPSIDLYDAKNLMEADRHTWLVDEALVRTDKLGMAGGIEARPPLLDLELMAAVRDIPFERHVSMFDTKILLKRAFKDTLPRWILNQPKRGWFSPGAKWLRHGALTDAIDAALAPGFASGTDELFNWQGVRAALAAHRARRAYRAPALIALLVFQLWSKRFGISV